MKRCTRRVARVLSRRRDISWRAARAAGGRAARTRPAARARSASCPTAPPSPSAWPPAARLHSAHCYLLTLLKAATHSAAGFIPSGICCRSCNAGWPATVPAALCVVDFIHGVTLSVDMNYCYQINIKINIMI